MAKINRHRQMEFLKACVTSELTLDEVMAAHGVTPMTFARWTMQPKFRARLAGMRRYLVQARDLQMELGARQAATKLTMASGLAIDPEKPQVMREIRAACVDLVRLARDVRRRKTAGDPHVDLVTKHATLYHPDLPADEVGTLVNALRPARDATAS